MLNDPINHLYFHFLSPVVSEFEKANAFFQGTDIEADAMMKELSTYYESLKSFTGACLPVEKVDQLNQLNRQNNQGVQEVREVYNRCYVMLLEAVEQVQKRLPSSKDIFKGLSYLHPTRVLNQVDRVSLTSLPMIHLVEEKIDEIDNQYRSISYADWQESGIFEEGIPSDSVSFWSGVLTYRNGRFGDRARYALACLTTPTSMLWKNVCFPT